MDALTFIGHIQSQPVLKGILSDSEGRDLDYAFNNDLDLAETIFRHLLSSISEDVTDHKKVAAIERIKSFARTTGKFQREAVQGDSSKMTINSGFKLFSKWKKYIRAYIDALVSHNYLEQTKLAEGELEHRDNHDVVNSIDDTKRIQDLLPDKADSSICLTNEEKCRALLLMTAFPGCREPKEPYKMLQLVLEVCRELSNLPKPICEACDGQPLSLLLIGGLLSFKPMVYNTWNMVKDDLVKIKQSEDDPFKDHSWHIFIPYCYDDLPYLLKLCFLSLTYYPIDYEIPARSLTNIWIADGFVELEEGETIEETSFKYLEQLVQRFLVCVSKRSFSGTIKCCRIRQSIHEFAIEQSRKVEFLVANPNMEELKCISRLAIHQDYKNQLERDIKDSFLAFDHMNVFRNVCSGNVLELRNSAVLEDDLWDVMQLPGSEDPDLTPTLSYLGLRGCKISSLPEYIGRYQKLQTLDVRDTTIETIPEKLWSIPELCHVYVNPNPNFKGPPSTAKIPDLQTLKTVAVHESWQENFLQCLINLKKLSFSNRDNPDTKSNPYWKSISNLLSRMVNLFSMAIVGDIVPSEFVDMRAFPNLETLKSIKFEGKWICRNLFIDIVKFPLKLTKLTLTKSGLAEDPMPRLEKLKALRYLSLKDGAYMGKKMVCSANGFPQLQILEIFELKNLEIWEVKPMAMSQLTTLRVVRCLKLKNLPNLEQVTDKVIDN